VGSVLIAYVLVGRDAYCLVGDVVFWWEGNFSFLEDFACIDVLRIVVFDTNLFLAVSIIVRFISFAVFGGLLNFRAVIFILYLFYLPETASFRAYMIHGTTFIVQSRHRKIYS